VYPDTSRQEYARRLLTEVETGNGTSQRSLARRAGMALGLTNEILKTLVSSGWVQTARVDGRLRYMITPEGIAEKARISTAYFAHTTRFYVEARDRIRERLSSLSRAWPGGAATPKRMAFYGAAAVGEIGYVCLQQIDLAVTAVFDPEARGRFFGETVRPIDQLADPAVWREFDVLAIMSFDDRVRREADTRLREAGFPAERVFWI
jgi:predicted transcriptional regulator